MNTVPRASLFWFFLGMLAALGPHLERLPFWLWAVGGVCALWRVQAWRGVWSWPGKGVKALVVLAVVAGVLAWYRNPTSLESGAATVIGLFFLKLLECHSRRDVYLITFVAFFVVALAFLFEQGLLVSAWMLVATVLLLTSLLALHQGDGRASFRRAVRPTLGLLLQAVPLMLVLFLVFPRVAPFWSVPLQSGQGKTGMSDTMSPGDISRLGRSDEVAFRVTFSGDPPPNSALYWRGFVLDFFNGRTWRPGYTVPRQTDAMEVTSRRPRPATPAWRYDVLLQPTGRHWLYAVPWAESDTRDVVRRRDNTLVSRQPINNRFQYRVTSYPSARWTRPLIGLSRQLQLRLPEGYNPRTRTWARTLRERHADDTAFIDTLLQHFHREPFVYTLQPAALGRHSVDEFLFDTREGFCEHYAGAFVFALRAAGIPARVVVGYQGGERHPSGEYLIVRQYDAHAWAEAWLPGRGWVRFDPTAAVAPERIRLGMAEALGADEAFMADSLTGDWARRSALLGRLRLWFDEVDYRWQRWVLGYDATTQTQTLKDWLGGVTPARLALFMGAVLGLSVLGVMLNLWGREWWRPRDPLAVLYRRFCRQMRARGVPPRPGETPEAYRARVREVRPEWAAYVDRAVRLFSRLAYAPLSPVQHRQGLSLLRRHLRRPRPGRGARREVGA